MAPADGLERVALPLEWADDEIPRDVEALIEDAEREGAEWEGAEGRFVASDYRWAWQVLRRLREEGLARPGGQFLEWGSGLGMVTILASLMGFDALGVELDPRLAAAAKRLARRHGASGRARFVRGSYEKIPGKGVPVVGARGQDVVYAYPWPGEEAGFRERFAAQAKPGALLLLALGPLDMEAWRMPGEREPTDCEAALARAREWRETAEKTRRGCNASAEGAD